MSEWNAKIHEIKFNKEKNKGPIVERRSYLSYCTYACETWPMSRTDENMLSIYERKILRSIFGGIQEKGTWRRSNSELYRSFNESNIVDFIKIQRIKQAGHVIRINKDRTTKKVFNAQPIGTQRKGRLNLRWIDGLEKDLLVLRTRN
ncbi:uncharacterized protein TNCV_1126481 [Trichonephila clavipes]|nr:uncharacterized protein TNCV_1126481 [Trichonephila clavipes]